MEIISSSDNILFYYMPFRIGQLGDQTLASSRILSTTHSRLRLLKWSVCICMLCSREVYKYFISCSAVGKWMGIEDFISVIRMRAHFPLWQQFSSELQISGEIFSFIRLIYAPYLPPNS